VLALQKAFVINIKKKNNMGSAIYAKMFKQKLKYDESKEQDNPDFFKQDEDYMAERKAAKNKKIDPFQAEFNKLQKVNKIKDVDLGTVKSTLVDKYSFNKSLDNYNKMTNQPGHNSNPQMVKESNDAFRKMENMKAKDSKGNVVSAMSIFIDD